MINEDLVTSGFDIELLLSEEYIENILLSLYESETIPHFIPVAVVNPDAPTPTNIQLFMMPPPGLASKRLYEVNTNFDPNPYNADLSHPSVAEALSIEILSSGNNMAKAVVHASISVLLNDTPLIPAKADLFVDIFLSSIETNGFQENVLLNIEVTDFEADILENTLRGIFLADYDRQHYLNLISQNINQHIDLGVVGKNKSVHKIEMKVFEATSQTPTAIGIYINLKLKKGPQLSNFVPDRGNIADAQNFLPKEHNIAFALPGAIYDRLGPDLYYRMGKQTSVCPEEYKYPNFYWGFTLQSISMGPEMVDNGVGSLVPSNSLRIHVNTEKQIDYMVDPDIDVYITLRPVITDGILTWNIDANASSLSITLGLLLLGSLATFIFTPAAWVYLLVNASIFTAAVGGTIALDELLLDGIAEDTIRDTNVLETIPHHLTIASKNWDPLYVTQHQLVANIVQMDIKPSGIFMLGKEINLGRDFQPSTDAVVSSVIKDADGKIINLQYNTPYVKDLDLINRESATADREPYLNIYQPTGYFSYFVDLSIEQIENRIQKKKINAIIPYVALKSAMDGGQIDKLLIFSTAELNKYSAVIYNQLKTVIESGHEDELRNEAIAKLDAGGCDSTNEDAITMMYHKVLDNKIYLQHYDKLTEYVDLILAQTFRPRLELTPEEIATLQQKNIWVLTNKGDGKPLEMVAMHSGTVYFRDRKDSVTPDNLLSLPHFKPS